jgi:transposase
MTLYCGIDLHANNSVVAVLDEEDQTVYEKRLPNDLATITEALGLYQSELAACVVESTYNWYWLVDGLMAAGFPVQLAHTSALPQYAGLKYSNDFSDARQLAHLLRLGLLPTGYIYPRQERALRDLLRRRLLLVRQRTMHHLSLQSLIARHSGRRLNAYQIKTLRKQQLRDYLEGLALLGGEVTYQAYLWLDQSIRQIEQELQHHIKPREDYQLLQSIPGTGPVLGTTIALETGTIERFASAGNYASYARCVKSEKIRVTRKMATNTWPGRLWRQAITALSGIPESNDTISARKPRGTPWWLKRLWPTSWPEPVITCSNGARSSM